MSCSVVFSCPRTCALLWRTLLVDCCAPSLEDATAMTRRPDKALGRRECRSGLPSQSKQLRGQGASVAVGHIDFGRFGFRDTQASAFVSQRGVCPPLPSDLRYFRKAAAVTSRHADKAPGIRECLGGFPSKLNQIYINSASALLAPPAKGEGVARQPRICAASSPCRLWRV